jgi:uncharacterized protein (DUF433 family)
MSALREIEQLLSGMGWAEKAQVLQWVVCDLGDAFPGIERRSDINGGKLYIVRTRIQIWVLVQARQLGASEVDLMRDYPALRGGSRQCLGLARTHCEEIEQQINENEAA